MDNVSIQFGLNFYEQIVVIPMGTNYDRLVADLFYYERDFVLYLSDNMQAHVN